MQEKQPLDFMEEGGKRRIWQERFAKKILQSWRKWFIISIKSDRYGLRFLSCRTTGTGRLRVQAYIKRSE